MRFFYITTLHFVVEDVENVAYLESETLEDIFSVVARVGTISNTTVRVESAGYQMLELKSVSARYYFS